MADQDPFAVNNIRVADNTTFNPNGTTSKTRQVTFFVGDHGPFTLTYPVDQATSARIKSDIQDQVQLLREINTP